MSSSPGDPAADAIWSRLANYVHWEKHKADCPADRIPTASDLGTFECSDDVLEDINSRLADLSAAAGLPELHFEQRFGVVCFGNILEAMPAGQEDGISVFERFSLIRLAALHRLWMSLPKENRPGHPFEPLVEAWLSRPREVETDARGIGILPQSLSGWTRDGPAILTEPRHDNEIPLATGIADEKQNYLPGLEPPESEVVPPPALVLAEAAGFGKLTAGAGARLDKRLLVHSLMAVPLKERRAGGRCAIRPTLREISHNWLWPPPAQTGTGTDERSNWRSSRHAPMLAGAMNACTLAGVILPDGREWRPVMFRVLPDFRDLDSLATIEIALPELSDRGPAIDRAALIAAGVVGDPAFDGCLCLASLWDRAKAKNGGFRIYATRPKALRDPDSTLIRIDGTRITGHPKNPREGSGGRSLWQPGDAPQKDWRHPEAVICGEERHPAADKVPILDRNDRRRLFYGHASDKRSKQLKSYYADQADRRLQQLEAEGRVVIEDCGRAGWRILERYPNSDKMV